MFFFSRRRQAKEGGVVLIFTLSFSISPSASRTNFVAEYGLCSVYSESFVFVVGLMDGGYVAF